MRCYMAIIRESFRWLVIIVTCVLGAALIVAATMLWMPIAILFALSVSPFATVRWAFVGDETWIESWKRVANDFGK